MSERALAHALAGKGHRLAICAPSFRGLTSYREDDHGTVIFRVPALRFTPNPGYRASVFPARWLANVVRLVRPHLIHVHNPFAIGLGLRNLARRHRIPLVGSNHLMPDNFLRPGAQAMPGYEAVRRWGWKTLVSFYEPCDMVVSPSLAASELLKEFGLRARRCVISNGVNTTAFRPGRNAKYLRSSFRIPPRTPVVLFCGRLAAEKCLPVLVEAFARILKRTEAWLVLAGEGPEESGLRRLSNRLGIARRVVFSGFVPRTDLKALYCLARAFAMPSTAELQSVASLEAMSCGTPVVAAASGALPEIVSDGNNGFLFQPGQRSAMAGRLLALLSNASLCARLGDGARRTARRHSMPKTVGDFERLYSRLIRPYNRADENGA